MSEVIDHLGNTLTIGKLYLFTDDLGGEGECWAFELLTGIDVNSEYPYQDLYSCWKYIVQIDNAGKIVKPKTELVVGECYSFYVNGMKFNGFGIPDGTFVSLRSTTGRLYEKQECEGIKLLK